MTLELSLKELYDEWDGSNSLGDKLKELYTEYKDSIEFKNKLIALKEYINDSENENPHRYSFFSYTSYAFKKLNQTLDNLLNDKPDRYSMDIKLYEGTAKLMHFVSNNKLLVFTLVAVPATPLMERCVLNSFLNPSKEIDRFYSDPALKRFNEQNFYIDNQCFAPYLLEQEDELNVYSTSKHFFTHLYCNHCDNGNFHADTHSGSPQDHTALIGSTRDNFEFMLPYHLRYTEIALSGKESKKILKWIRDDHARTLYNPKKYSIGTNGETCVEATQDIYSETPRALDYTSFTDAIGEEHLTSHAGAFAFYKHHASNRINFFKTLTIFAQTPKEQPAVKTWEPTERPCDMVPGQTFFGKYFKCTETPAGQLIPVGYEPNFNPTSEYTKEGEFIEKIHLVERKRYR